MYGVHISPAFDPEKYTRAGEIYIEDTPNYKEAQDASCDTQDSFPDAVSALQSTSVYGEPGQPQLKEHPFDKHRQGVLHMVT